MRNPNVPRNIVEIDGIVRRIDPARREVEIQIAGTALSFDVRSDCVITLRGERVKLRLIQPRDRVHLRYTEHPEARIAATIEVQPSGPVLL